MDDVTRRAFLKLLGKGAGAAIAPKSPLLDILTNRGGAELSDHIPGLEALPLQILKRLKEAGGDVSKIYDAAKFGIDNLGLGIDPTSGIEKRSAKEEVEQIPIDFYFDPKKKALISKYEHKGPGIREDVYKQEGERFKEISTRPDEISDLLSELRAYIRDEEMAEAEGRGATPGEMEHIEIGEWPSPSGIWEEYGSGFNELENKLHDIQNWRQTIDTFGGINPYVTDLEDRLTQGMAGFGTGRPDYSMQSIQDDLSNKLGVHIPTKNTEAWMANFTDPKNVKKRQDKLFNVLSQVADFIPAGRILKGGSRLFNTLLKGETRQKARQKEIPQLEYKPQEPFNPIETKQADKVHVRPNDKKLF